MLQVIFKGGQNKQKKMFRFCFLGNLFIKFPRLLKNLIGKHTMAWMIFRAFH